MQWDDHRSWAAESKKKQIGTKDERGERAARAPWSGWPVLTVCEIQGIHFYSDHKSHITCTYTSRRLYLAVKQSHRLGFIWFCRMGTGRLSSTPLSQHQKLLPGHQLPLPCLPFFFLSNSPAAHSRMASGEGFRETLSMIFQDAQVLMMGISKFLHTHALVITNGIFMLKGTLY